MEYYKKINHQIGTLILIFINLCFYIFMLIKYGSTTSPNALIGTGANFGYLIAFDHQYWRWITAAFIHIGPTHLFMNMLMLYFMGQELEMIMGTFRFIALYLLAGIGGNILSFAFNLNISAGASTALFGMFAGFLVLSNLYPENYYLKRRAQSFLLLITLNIVFGMISSGLDMYGHVGGLIFGAIATYGLGSKQLTTSAHSKWRNLVVSIVTYLLLASICIVIGLRKYT